MNGEYKSHREQVLYNTAKAQLPDTQHMVENHRTAATVRREIARIERDEDAAKARLRELRIRRWNLTHRVQRIEQSRYQSDGLGNRIEESDPRRRFIRACPVDGCRGFLSQQLKCGLCETYACGDCMGVIGTQRDDDHVCDPNDVETAKLIRKESKPCPKCGINISKIDGCDQMWCVQCHTAFSWMSGAIVRGTIHNPHYFEMLRNQSPDGEIPRQPGDIPGIPGIPGGGGQCVRDLGRLTTPLHTRLRQWGIPFTSDTYVDVMANHRDLLHVFDVVIPRLRGRPTDNADIRMKYLMGEYTEDEFKRQLMKREKTIEKNAALLGCLQAQIDITLDVYHPFLEGLYTVKAFIDRLRNVKEVTDSYMKDIGKRFSCVARVASSIRPYTAERETDDSATSKKRRLMSAHE